MSYLIDTHIIEKKQTRGVGFYYVVDSLIIENREKLRQFKIPIANADELEFDRLRDEYINGDFQIVHYGDPKDWHITFKIETADAFFYLGLVFDYDRDLGKDAFITEAWHIFIMTLIKHKIIANPLELGK